MWEFFKWFIKVVPIGFAMVLIINLCFYLLFKIMKPLWNSVLWS